MTRQKYIDKKDQHSLRVADSEINPIAIAQEYYTR